ncbi:MAG: hypothetical protein ACKVVT_15685 [Dehalococcoidia bacterium]
MSAFEGRAAKKAVPDDVADVEGPRRTPAEAAEALRAFRKAHSLDGVSVRELIDKGRRT